MSYRVRFSRRADRYLSRLPEQLQLRILEQVAALGADPFAGRTLAGGGGRYTTRVGPLRIVYSIDVTADLVTILVIGPRGDIYKDL